MRPDVDDAVNGMWENRSFHNYADHALSPEFAAALEGLAELGERPALLCSEAVWWRCHRRIITDHLLARGERVDHLMGPGRTRSATMTPGARVEGHQVTYPAQG